ncbi:hypothetical protein [Frateuria terrea]|uniref:LTXXQ motif family protein n=1 Tax=Frateuria terrea TaxID=529704 RepID=A0A1H6V9W4_9GAMM|nr:hypothetical protein [Frateuria terrea]SEJ01351.1 hypothetical protein SAMN04487997_2198 [Frateuria terrea]SFP65089.1 hypothetical protein SAMN02927913_3032 [Frateuria terrea]
MISRLSIFVVALALVTPACFAQQQTRPQPSLSAVQRQQQQNRQVADYAKTSQLGNEQALRNGMTNQTKLRDKLAEAWRGMGLSPQAAKTVADAYDADLASQMHHTSIRGRSDQEVAAMLQSALAAKHYLVADQLLIDYQRAKLNLAEMGKSDAATH